MATGTSLLAAPESDVDPYSDAALLDPWAGYRAMRDAGPVVWLPRYGMFAATRYSAVRQVLLNADTFSSGRGVMMNDHMNMAEGSLSVLRGKNALCSDGVEHDRLRRAIIKPLRPVALRQLTASITREADSLVERLVARRSFDAVTDLANHLPMSIVSNLVGLPEPGREKMLIWAAEMFNCFGPPNERMRSAVPVMEEMVRYATAHAVREQLTPGSWAADLHEAADRGELPAEALPEIVIDYIGPSLDTTIFAITSAVWLFARHPDQWDLLRADHSLIPGAINEVLRTE
jgi:cytochrome P450